MKEIKSKFYVLIIFLPIILFLFLAESSAWLLGETIPHEKLAKRQKLDSHLLVFTQQPYYTLKLARYTEEKPEVVWIGTSRSMHARSAMFEPYHFYNACLTAWTFDQLTEYLKLTLSAHKPRVVIFSLDYFMFAPGWIISRKHQNDFHTNFSYDDHLKALGSFLRFSAKSPKETLGKLIHYFNNKKFTSTEQNQNLIGMPAIMEQLGVRYDGSFQLSSLEIRNSAKNITKNSFIASVPGAPSIDPKQIEALKRFAQLAKENNVVLVGIALPILKDGLDYLDNEKSYWDYSGVWRDFNKPEMRQLFKEHGIHFFDAQRVAYHDKTTFVEASHPSEKGILSTLLFLKKDPEFRNIFDKLDYASLEKEYQNTIEKKLSFEVYKDRF